MSETSRKELLERSAIQRRLMHDNVDGQFCTSEEVQLHSGDKAGTRVTEDDFRRSSSNLSYSHVPVISHPQMEGYLKKRSRHLKHWRTRWFVLQDHHLCSFAKKGKYKKPTEMIDLRIFTSVGVSGVSTKRGCFDVSSDKMTFTMVAASESEMEDWILAIKRAIWWQGRIISEEPEHSVFVSPAVFSGVVTVKGVSYTDVDGDRVSFYVANGALHKDVNNKFARVVTQLTFSMHELSLYDQEGWGGRIVAGNQPEVITALRSMARECKVLNNIPKLLIVPGGKIIKLTFDLSKILGTPIVDTVLKAINLIELAVPALNFIRLDGVGHLKITCKEGGCWSHVGFVPGGNEMNLDLSWESGRGPPVGTVIHEFLHFLGIQHEHQRSDRADYVTVDPEKEKKNPNNLAICADIHPWRFDSASIMHYSENEIDSGNKAWAEIGQRLCLSELDKLFLNGLYPPISCDRYTPQRGTTGLWYCGRRVMENNNFPYGSVEVDGRCGPNNGPNCPSCRMYGCSNGDPSPLVRGRSRQGDTGLFYCGRRFAKQVENADGFCGPNNGLNCSECAEVLEQRQ